MLWYKGWLETRFKVLVVVAFMGLILTLAYSGEGVRTPASINGFVISTMFLGVTTPVLLAGAGITTQPAVKATKGLHGSMHFTLSLPVSRLGLLAVRAGLGWLEMAAVFGAWCCALWILFPVLREVATAAELFEHEVAFVACASGLYAINVLLATFLDDLWRTYGSMIASGALWWLSNHTPLPASANIFRAMGEASPLFAHTMPWTAMAFSFGLTATLFLAALKIVQAREY
jgi:hypothetical protein